MLCALEDVRQEFTDLLGTTRPVMILNTILGGGGKQTEDVSRMSFMAAGAGGKM